MTAVETIRKQFTAMGARVKIGTDTRDRPFTINVSRDKEGEFFDLQVSKEVDLLVQDMNRPDRHLLLFAKSTFEGKPDKTRILCGHDERHWFSATVPKPVTTVIAAKQALKPDALVRMEKDAGIRSKDLHKRHKKLRDGTRIHRQGEFFFVPDKDINPKPDLILKNEPMRGGGHHFHYAQFLYRVGGRRVWVDRGKVLTDEQYRQLTPPNRKYLIARVADANVYVKGRITHEEHATVNLGDVWHRVHLNTESRNMGRGFAGPNMFID